MTEDEEFEALEQRLNMKEQEYEQINHPNGVTTWKTKPKVKPEALRLADELCAPIPDYQAPTSLEEAAAAELRRLHALNQELLEALEAINKKCFSHVDGRDLFAQMHPRRMLDIKRRVDGRETWFEGDWLTDLWHAIKKSRAAIAKAQGASNE